MKLCTIEGCDKPHSGKGLCGMHLMRKKRQDPAYCAREVKTTAEWKKRNPELHAQQQSRYGKKHAAKLKVYLSNWKSENWEEYSAYLKSQKKRVKQATPAWVDHKDFQAIYIGCPEGHHVDHIIPIVNPMVCGLNVPANLQYLTKEDNLKKNNKFDGTYDNNGWRKERTKKNAPSRIF